MDFKSRARSTGAIGRPSSTKHLGGRHTDPIISRVEACMSGGNRRTTKRKAEQSPERASKRSRTAGPPFSGPPSHDRDGFVSAYSGWSDSTGNFSYVVTSTPISASISTQFEEKKSTKRKSEETQRPRKASRKRRRMTCSPGEDSRYLYQATTEDTTESYSSAKRDSSEDITRTFSYAVTSTPISVSISTQFEEEKSTKRKSEETQRPRKASRKRKWMTRSPCEGSRCLYQATTEDTTESYSSAKRDCSEDITRTFSYAVTSTPISTSISTQFEEEKSRKRKSEETQRPRKASRKRKWMTRSPCEGSRCLYQATTEDTTESYSSAKRDSSEDITRTFSYAVTSTPISVSISTQFEEEKSTKRKSEETQRPRKASRKRKWMTRSPCEGSRCLYQATTEDTTESYSSAKRDCSEDITRTFSYAVTSTPISVSISTQFEEEKSTKRKSEETQRPRKASRKRKWMTRSPCEGSRCLYQATTEDTTESYSSAKRDCSEDITRTFSYAVTSTPISASISTQFEEEKSTKRKSEETQRPRKASRKRKWVTRSPCEGSRYLYQATTEDTTESYSSAKRDCSEDITRTFSSAVTSTPSSASISTQFEEEKSTKRKSEETQRPRKASRKRRRMTCSPGEGTSYLYQATTEDTDESYSSAERDSSEDNTGSSYDDEDAETLTPTSSITSTESQESERPKRRGRMVLSTRADFEAKYKQSKKLGEGGFGVVFTGCRKEDSLPVAIKHINNFLRTTMDLDGEIVMIPQEVALLLKLRPAAGQTSAVVSLLDWYDLGSEVIIVLERPMPCMDLMAYLESKRFFLPDHKTKLIIKQLLDGLNEIHSKGVFHGDIKPENILIETSSTVPRVRIIDFGCGTFVTDMYTVNEGTHFYTTPEYYQHGRSTTEATTVWQLGMVLYEITHGGRLPFYDSYTTSFAVPKISDNLSTRCKDFLRDCLAKSPAARPTLETLRQHPWLMSSPAIPSLM